MKMNNGNPLRIVFQFSDACNMTCPYCYCHFTNEPIERETCFLIIDKCYDLGVKIITFGGGDPLSCSFIWELIIYAKNKNFEIHLDTNGLSLTHDKYDLISKHVTLLSLPLDGPTAKIHEVMRGSRKHFDIIIGHLSKISTYECRVKINTVVSSLNYNQLNQLGTILEKYRVAIWSLQQFWPMERGLAHAEHYKISNKDYTSAVANVSNNGFPFLIEYGSISERRQHHFFVTHSGRAYIHSPQQDDSYFELGSFFDPLTIAKWKTLAYHSFHPNALHRYKSLQRQEK